MKTLLNSLVGIFLLTGLVSVHAQSYYVVEKESRNPVSNAHIYIISGKVIATTDAQGIFDLDAEKYPVVFIQAIGFKTKEIRLASVDNLIELEATVIKMNTELIIQDERAQSNNVHAYHSQESHQNMDNFLSQIDGVSMIQRGAFAWEPAIRGQSDQRMNLVIDGMQVFKACVDKMDPITSYVETNNLAKLQVDKSGTNVAEFGNGNSTINLVTQKAQQDRFSIDAETAFRVPDLYRNYSLTINTSDAAGKNAFRFSGSYKKADDLHSANFETVENTQYEKLNLYGHYQHLFDSGNSIEVNYITDKAYDVGYPALLMDATQALADIGRVQFNFADSEQSFQLRSIMLYANSIRHTMDDYERDVANRQVMRGMYMPMFGETTTFGGKVQGAFALNHHPIDWHFDAFTSLAYGDMEMISLDPNIQDMLIYNLNEVYTHSMSLGFVHHMRLGSHSILSLEQNTKFKTLGTHNEAHASLFEGVYNKELVPRARILLSGSAEVIWQANDEWSFSNSIVYSERMGNHMELFGHYIYNYTDGFFYDGNPWLTPERSINADVNTSWSIGKHSVSVTAFYKYYFDYIGGVISNDISNFNFQFKTYSNVGNAIMTGAEIRTINNWDSNFRLENRIAYTYAQNLDLNEPLPLIPPLYGNSTLSYVWGNSSISMSADWSAQQSRIAIISSNEDKTKAFYTLGIGYERSWLGDKLVSSVQLRNITDQYYNRHTSIGNIPESGFSAMISLKYKL